jgi:Ca2+-binding EF-hand superfamily protein
VFDWEGYLTSDDFLSVALVSMQKQAERMDDVRAAFRAFDHNGDGTISKEELKEAMQRFGHSFTEDECDEMFLQADTNGDGAIDWEEFVEMMVPGYYLGSHPY